MKVWDFFHTKTEAMETKQGFSNLPRAGIVWCHQKVWYVLILALVQAASIDTVPIRLQHFQNYYGSLCNCIISTKVLTTFPAEVYSLTEYDDHEYAK